MAIADVYDALISERPYKKAFSHEKAVAIISEGKGTQFDPILTELFEEIEGEFNRIAVRQKCDAVCCSAR
jgi:putative two-component system response regulator